MRGRDGFCAIIVLLFLVLISAGGIAAVNGLGPTKEQLEADVREIASEISEAISSGNKYAEGSLIRSQYELRIATLRTTKAMLDQKRRAWIRGIKISYVVEGRVVEIASLDAITSIEREIAKAELQARAARAKADSYTGGLVQSLALVEEQTHLVAQAVAQQRLAFAKLGMIVPVNGSNPVENLPVGRSLDDKGAL